MGSRRASRETAGDREKRRRLAELCVAVTIAQSPATLTGITEQLDVEQLSDDTHQLVELITEYPTLCAEVGPSVVAENTGLPEPTVRHFAWLELTPPAELAAIPSLEESLKILSPEPPLELLGALEQWRDELRRGVGGQCSGKPSTWRRDSLYWAACHEQAAIEAERQGFHAAALEWIEKAVWALAGEAAAHRQSA